MLKCNRCDSEDSENYYKDEYSDEIICEDCLLEIDGITTETTKDYYLDGDYLGDDNDLDEVIANICDNISYKKLEE